MNLVDSKEYFLGSYNHDFPRLAKQSGFFFQLYSGKVNWSEIESLNLDDITQNRNFELLEQNLLNVINFNLDEDHDLKISDRNFVKLFKVAQLGIDYLSYCEWYLDRCVVLLQEQLMSVQEEFESLKNENEGKNSYLKKTKNSKKNNSYQCEKCEKVFISDVYLKCHEKRRHSNLSTPESKGLQKKLVNAFQQTESKETSSVSIQTLLCEPHTASQKNEEIYKIKKNHNKKIKRLEKNLSDVRARLQKAEKSLQETREANSALIPLSFPPSAHYPFLQFMSPCFPPSRSMGEAAESQKSFPKSRSPVSDLIVNVGHKVSEGRKSPDSIKAILKEYDAGGAETNKEAEKLDLICDKENMDPQNAVNANVIKPLPPPRKTKKKIKEIVSTEENVPIETFNQLGNSVDSVGNAVPFSNESVDFTAVKERSDPNIYSENAEDTNVKEKNSNESLNVSREKSEENLASFFKKVVKRSPPKLHKLSKNLRRPLTNLCDSVSSTGKTLMKIEKKAQDAKGVLVDDLNNHLRELGIDPEWEGIPKKTMKQKLKDLTHRRKLLSKENPLYCSVRQSAEEKIFEKLRRNFFIRKTLPQKPFPQEMEEEIHPTDGDPWFKTHQPENERNRKWDVLLDADMDSWSKVSEVEENQRKQESPVCSTTKQQQFSDSDSEEGALQTGKKILNSRVFQIKQGNVESREKRCKKKGMNLNETNSDPEDFSFRSVDGSFKANHFESSNEKLPVGNLEALSPLTR